MLTSWVRPDRIGPIGSELCEWKTAANLVVRPSTTSSNTMSAMASPLWLGTAAALLSIFATSAGRNRMSSALATGSPVSGWRIVAGTVVEVVELDVVVVALTVVVVVVAGAVVVGTVESAESSPPPPQAAVTSARAARPAIHDLGRRSFIRVLSGGQCAHRAAGGYRTFGGCRPACRRRRRHSWAARSTSVP